MKIVAAIVAGLIFGIAGLAAFEAWGIKGTIFALGFLIGTLAESTHQRIEEWSNKQ